MRRMKRKGTSLVFFTVMVILVVAGAIVSNFLFHQYVSTLQDKAVDASGTQFTLFGLREEIMNAECITQQRGIFIKQRIENPDDLSCIGPAEDPATVIFRWREGDGGDSLLNDHSYLITPQGPGEPSDVSGNLLDQMSLDTILDQATTTQEHPVVIYDRDTNQYYQGVIIFAA